MKFSWETLREIVAEMNARRSLIEYVLLLVVVIALTHVFKQRILHMVAFHQCDVYNDVIIYDCSGRDPAGVR
jgi:hypothetical protein